MTDIDAVETEEWLEALDAVVESDGPRRAHDLVERLGPTIRQAAGEISAQLGYRSPTEA